MRRGYSVCCEKSTGDEPAKKKKKRETKEQVEGCAEKGHERDGSNR